VSYKDPSEYEVGNGTFEFKPTGGIQAIALKPFTVTKIEKFNSKAGELLCIIETEETFPNIEYKKEDSDEKTTGDVNRFFASPRDIKKFFTNAEVMYDVNENGNKIRTMIEKVPFDAEAIKRDASLKGKTHYVFKKPSTTETQEKIA
jgi:hypothetical protein